MTIVVHVVSDTSLITSHAAGLLVLTTSLHTRESSTSKSKMDEDIFLSAMNNSHATVVHHLQQRAVRCISGHRKLSKVSNLSIFS